MNSYEKESLIKGFVLFFIVQFLFLSFIFYFYLNKTLNTNEINISNEMIQCSYTLKCDKYKIEFEKQDEKILYNKILKNKEEYGLYMYFKISSVDTHVLEIILEKSKYDKIIKNIYYNIFYEYILYILLILISSFLIAIYTIRPLKKALELNDQFIKDILHDFNTPLSSLKINIDFLQKVNGKNDIINRINSSILHLLSFQDNLKYHLNHSILSKEKLILNDILLARINYFENIHKNINYNLDIKNNKHIIYTNKNAFIRILDNIISNASKYNSKNGNVILSYDNNILCVKDDGIGIKNINNVFNRYYKEHARGTGLGLNIVQKLCKELEIDINIKSKQNFGTSVYLNLSKLL